MKDNYPIRQVFLASADNFRKTHRISYQQGKALLAVSNCKSGALGFNVSECAECGHIQIHACSCRNRNCPNCQSLDNEVWIDKRRSELLDVKYFHTVFTVPAQLNALFYANQSALYSLILRAAGKTLLTLSQDRRYLGATPGIIAVLHTWGQTLSYHPHVHCIISSAGLSKAGKPVIRDGRFFIPVRAAMKMFRGKFLDGLQTLWETEQLKIPESEKDLRIPACWHTFIDSLYFKDWTVHIKETLNGSGNAIQYVSRYINRIAISNSRIENVSDDTVTFRYKDYRDGARTKRMTLSHEEFIRRFLMHVLPKGFQKIRYFGYLANSVRKKKLDILFRQQGYRLHKQQLRDGISKSELILAVLGVDPKICPCCGKPSMRFAGRHYNFLQ